ncbi:hypothetical protein HYC85_004146 [Camellia sinensis]|uniref:glucan endo-1,3-beta-D-glucosidase n=1 Tax=Camellia sinensis TaxID=4442 RepID=A0A7J7HXF1_CAMSI|nr:hypothetical protein HYC85_004146 [Camellia sinensis]
MVAAVGINYGQIANNLPSPENVFPLVRSIGATKVKLYDADPRVLKAFANTNVEFIVGLGNEFLSKMRDPNNAQTWVETNVQSYLPATKITCITIGNEVLTFNDTSLSNDLLPAMQGIHNALVSLNLDKQVSVTTAHSLAILEKSYPPSSGTFRKDLTGCITQVLNFHVKTGSPFLINAYPYFAYKSNPKQVPIDFVLFQPNSGIVDPVSNLHYDNMLFAQIDAVYSALASLGFKKVPLQISETGWPSKGDEDEAGANLDNAKKYNSNVIKLIAQKKGTPLKPNCELNIYVLDRHRRGTTACSSQTESPAYSLGLAGGNISTPTTTTGTPPSAASPLGTSSAGYMSISSAMTQFGSHGCVHLDSKQYLFPCKEKCV